MREGHRRTAVILVLCFCLALGLLLWCAIWRHGIVESIFLFVMTALMGFLIVIKTSYAIRICRQIKKGDLRVREDVVAALNEQVDFKDSNQTISFRFKDYQKIVYAPKNCIQTPGLVMNTILYS